MPYVQGLYTGVPYYNFIMDSSTDAAALDAILDDLVDKNKQDSVVGMVIMPTLFSSPSQVAPVSEIKSVSRLTSFDGYIPKNKKLLTYPYNFLCVDSLNTSKNYRYEFFADPDNCGFAMECGASLNPEIICAPMSYNGGGAGLAGANYTESVSCTGFPQCAFTIDTFRAWLAQKSTSEFLSMAGSLAPVAAGAAVGGPAGAVVGGILGAVGIGQQINTMTHEATQGSKARGSIGSGTEVATRKKDFYFKKMGVTREYAMMIDDFFNRYGYSVCRVKLPNINVRPHWTYTKTQNCSMAGDIPADDMAKIKSIFNKGITFWPNASEVGNYNLDNSPSTGG